MAKKKVVKAVNEGEEVQNSKVVMTTMNEDHQTASNLKNLNDLLVKQTMDLRQQVAGLNNIKKKLELDLSQAQLMAQAYMEERDLHVQKHKDSEEGNSDCLAVFDVERMLNASVISLQISQRDEENQKWRRRLESCSQEEKEKQSAVLEAWKIEKEALETAIFDREAKISDMVRLRESLEKSWQTEKQEMENTISSQEEKISKFIELREAMEESWKMEKEELQRTISILKCKAREEARLDEESKKTIDEQNLYLAELREDVSKLNQIITDLNESHKDLVNTNNQIRRELQQSQDGYRTVSSQNQELNGKVRKLEEDMELKDGLLESLKEEMDAVEERETEWKKRFKDASACGEQVLNMLRKTAELLTGYEGGELSVAAESGEGGNGGGIRKYEEELEAICESFRERAEKVHEMSQRMDEMTAELVECEKRAGMNARRTIFSSLTGACIALALAFVAKLHL